MRGRVELAGERHEKKEAIRECDIVREVEANIPNRESIGPRAWPTAIRGYALARAGRRGEAEAALTRLQAEARDMYVPPHHQALVLHGLGATTRH